MLLFIQVACRVTSNSLAYSLINNRKKATETYKTNTQKSNERLPVSQFKSHKPRFQCTTKNHK